ncbi:hypothetical protein KAJ27_07240 [bacterium]|nr:hypothetical protein [bacterium]
MRKYLLLLIPIIALIVGCISDAPVSTGFTSEDGYSINLKVSTRNIPYGGSASVMATVRDPAGAVVKNADVIFGSKLGGTFKTVTQQDGICSTTYTAPKNPAPTSDDSGDDDDDSSSSRVHISESLPIQDQINANYRGALSAVDVMLFSSALNESSGINNTTASSGDDSE